MDRKGPVTIYFRRYGVIGFLVHVYMWLRLLPWLRPAPEAAHFSDFVVTSLTSVGLAAEAPAVLAGIPSLLLRRGDPLLLAYAGTAFIIAEILRHRLCKSRASSWVPSYATAFRDTLPRTFLALPAALLCLVDLAGKLLGESSLVAFVAGHAVLSVRPLLSTTRASLVLALVFPLLAFLTLLCLGRIERHLDADIAVKWHLPLLPLAICVHSGGRLSVEIEGRVGPFSLETTATHNREGEPPRAG